jgi:hypothetical protein
MSIGLLDDSWCFNEACLSGSFDIIVDSLLLNPQIKNLTVKSDFINNEEMKYFAEVLPYTNIEKIDFRYNRFDDRGVSYLMAAIPRSLCTVVILDGNEITDFSVLYFKNAIKNSKIRTLSLKRCLISRNGRDGISQALRNALRKRERQNTSSNKSAI